MSGRSATRGGTATASPVASNALPYNDWRRLPVAPVETFVPTLPVTVVVSYFEAPAALEALLAGLERQTYPRELFEVVVVDDGSSTPLRGPATALPVRVIHQERRGFGLARARNNGAWAAAHEVLVFLDGDVIPDAGLLVAHARWHHVVADALTLGFRVGVPENVDAAAVRGHPGPLEDLLGNRPADHRWESQLRESDELTTRGCRAYGPMLGANFAMRREFYLSVGGCDGSFTRYGGEDTELAYRAHAYGGVVIPARDARVWHRERSPEERIVKSRQRQVQRAKVANLIPDRMYRGVNRRRAYRVPRHVLTVVAGVGQVADLAGDLDDVLAGDCGDIVIRVDPGRCPADRVWLEEYFETEPRVQIGAPGTALEAFPASPFHFSVSAGAPLLPEALTYLMRRLGAAVSASTVLPGGHSATVTRGWALHRARRTGLPVSAFGETLSMRRVRVRRTRGQPGPVAGLQRVVEEIRDVRDLRTARAFLAWLVHGIAHRLRTRRSAGRPGASAAQPPGNRS